MLCEPASSQNSYFWSHELQFMSPVLWTGLPHITTSQRTRSTEREYGNWQVKTDAICCVRVQGRGAHTTSSMVILVSAMFVARTILQTPDSGFKKTHFYSSPDNDPCSANTQRPPSPQAAIWEEDYKRDCSLWISIMPGRKTRMAPAFWACPYSTPRPSPLSFQHLHHLL